jgi:hypothetical protein
MKRIFILTALFLAAAIGEAMAGAAPACPGVRLNSTTITSTFNDKLLCASKPSATSNRDRWAEEHMNGGQLYEHAKGSSDKVDPRRLAGTWAAVKNTGNDDLIRYNYGTGGTYNWGVWEDKTKGSPSGPATSVFHFCDSAGTTKVASGTVRALPSASDPNPCGY